MDRKPVPSSSSRPTPPVNLIPSSDQNDDRDDELPGYSGPSIPAPARTSSTVISQNPNTIPGLPPINFSLYAIPSVTLSKDSTTLETTHSRYSTSVPALLDLIQKHISLPPHPQIRIMGKREDRLGGAIDFDIKISMMGYLVKPTEGRGGRWNYMRLLNEGEVGWRGGREVSSSPSAKRGLEEWVERYVAEEGKDKSFTLQKTISNYNTPYLEGQIRTLLASLSYPGTLSISFPTTHSTLTIRPPKPKQWYSAITAAFTPAQTRKYQVVEAVWPYAALAPGEAGGQGNEWAVRSEMGWWEDWQGVLRGAVLGGKRVWLGNEEWMEWCMGGGGGGLCGQNAGREAWD